MAQDSKHWVIQADCVKYLQNRKAKTPIKLIIADPPYNFGQTYKDYTDKLKHEEYLFFTVKWISAIEEALASDGTLWVFAPEEWVSFIDVTLRDLKMHLRRHCIWAFGFGQKAQNNFTRSHCHMLYFVKDKNNFTFNTEAVAVKSARQLVYKDKRAAGLKPPDATWMLLMDQLAEGLPSESDVQVVSRVCGSFKERQPHSPNQLPVALLERIVLACSNPGDLVYSPFCGAGSEGVAAVRHGRNFLGTDTSETCVVQSRERISKEAGL